MKISRLFWVFILFIATVKTSEYKTFQMIYAKNQYNPLREQDNKDIVYSIKTDNNLYIADVTEKKEKYEEEKYEEEKVKLFTLKKQEDNNIDTILSNFTNFAIDDIEEFEGRLMLIGQPIEYKTKKNDNAKWVMPAITKKKYFSFFKSTDICIIIEKQVTINASRSERKKLVYKIAEGHRTLANFVGIISIQQTNADLFFKGMVDNRSLDSNISLLFSSSKWPTSKINHLDGSIVNKKNDDSYILDGLYSDEYNFLLRAEASSKSFYTKQIKYIHLTVKKNIPEKVNVKLLPPIDVHYLPKIILNPKFIFEKDIQTTSLTIKKSIQNKLLQSKKDKYKVYVIAGDKVLFVPVNEEYKSLYHKNSTLLKDDFFTIAGFTITSSAMNFEDNQLFCGLYNQATKKSYIGIIEIKKDSSK